MDINISENVFCFNHDCLMEWRKTQESHLSKINQLKHTTYASVINKNILFLSVMQIENKVF